MSLNIGYGFKIVGRPTWNYPVPLEGFINMWNVDYIVVYIAGRVFELEDECIGVALKKLEDYERDRLADVIKLAVVIYQIPNKASLNAGALENVCLERYRDTRPRNLTMTMKGMRLATFSNWQTIFPSNVTELAAAGFYYSPHSKLINCYDCGRSFQEWEVGKKKSVDNIHEDNCEFFRAYKKVSA